MKLFRYIPGFLTNKFLLGGAAFVVWMLFFDRNDLFTQIERRSELHSLQESKEYYTTQIAQERKTSEELKSNPSTIEKYAREKYLMKRDNEDLFLVEPLEKHSKDIQ
jgi:cell division protein DivIC